MNSNDLLIQKGWNKEPSIPYREAVAREASTCYTYNNSNGTQIGILYYPDASTIRIRLSGTRGNNFNYFEIKLNNNLDAVINGIDELKDAADINNYFSFYFGLQSNGEVAILAWEQWEGNYK